MSLLIAFAPLVFTQTVQMLSILLLPFSRKAFRAVNRAMAWIIWGFWGWGLTGFYRVEFEMDGESLPEREDAIVFSNHQEMGDIVILMALALKAGRAGDLKWLVKDIIKYIPGIGWGMLFLDCVFLKRDWAKDEKTLRQTFARIADNRLPVWLISFPEGTRITKAKREKLRAKSIAAGQQPFDRVLPPRPGGFAASVTALREHVTAIYSVTIGYVGDVPSLVGLIRGDMRKVHVRVRRTPVKDLPAEWDGMSRWLVADFREKDQWLAAVGAAGPR